jgi:excisionase family DNA binding protein
LKSSAPPAEPGLLTIADVQRKLGGIHRTTVWRLIKSGQIAFVEVGSRKMFRPEAVAAYIARRETPAKVDRRRSA